MPSRRFLILAGAVGLAALALHSGALARPMLVADDFQILAASWTWEATRANLWRPANEHIMPLGRLTTFLVVQLAGRPTHLPVAAALQGPIALLIGLGLVYLFVRRELGEPAYGLLAVALFGVTTAYIQAVAWFAASFSLLAFDTLLLALLAAQRWRQTGRWPWLAGCVMGCFLAPAWFASGILAGPLCVLYLWPGPGKGQKSQGKTGITNNQQPISNSQVRGGANLEIGYWSFLVGNSRLAFCLFPLLGSALFLAVSLPLSARDILHLEHYGDQTALEAFNPWVGLGYTARSLVDNVLLGTFGVADGCCPVWLVPFGLLLLAGLGVWWWRRAPDRRLLLLGLGFIFGSYLLTYSARAAWDYDLVRPWTRYQLLPHLGLVLFVCGGLPFRGAVVGGQWSLVGLFLLVRGFEALFVCQIPRALGTSYDPEQMAVLRRIEEVDARCRQLHIAPETAQQALDWLEVPGCGGRVNGWEFLRGSERPRPVPLDEARRLLDN